MTGVLDVRLTGQVGRLALDVAFSSGGGVTALFGRSGVGKTSVVNMIAGLIRPAGGRIAVDGRALFDADAGIDLPTHRRRIGYVFQDARLFPHLSVAANLRYGRSRGADRRTLDRLVDLLGLAPLLDRRPGSLSGGETQRVAIGRALAAEPDVLLMDEPLASLDLAHKAEILPYLEALAAEGGVPILYVSHAVDEVLRLADQMVLLSDGKVVAAGPVDEVFGRSDLLPVVGRFEAGAVVETTVGAHDAATSLTRLDFAGGAILVPQVVAEPGTGIRVRVRARDVALATARPTGISIRNILPGTVTGLTAGDPPFVAVAVAVGEASLIASVTSAAVADLALAPGVPVHVLIKSLAIERRSLGRPVVRTDRSADPPTG